MMLTQLRECIHRILDMLGFCPMEQQWVCGVLQLLTRQWKRHIYDIVQCDNCISRRKHPCANIQIIKCVQTRVVQRLCSDHRVAGDARQSVAPFIAHVVVRHDVHYKNCYLSTRSLSLSLSLSLSFWAWCGIAHIGAITQLITMLLTDLTWMMHYMYNYKFRLN